MLSPVRKLLDGLEKVRVTGDSTWSACCPAHEDKTPSLSIKELSDGRVLIHCFAGCNAMDVVESAGMSWGDIIPDEFKDRTERQMPTPKSEIERQIISVYSHITGTDREQLILDIAALMRREGVRLSDKDLARERVAWERVRA